MTSGYKKIYWGLFFSTFHLNLGNIQVLPAFIGWLIVAYGLYILHQETSHSSFKLAHNFTLIMAGASFVGFYSSITGERYHITDYTSLIIPFIELFFIYYFMEGSIDYLRASNQQEAAYSYEGVLRAFMIIYIANTIAASIAYTIVNHGVLTLCMVIGILQIIWLMHIVRGINNLLKPPEEPQSMSPDETQTREDV